MSDLDRIKETIRKLRERTVARGCSEAEAATAMEKAASLMREHGLSAADLVMGSAVCERGTTERPHVRDVLATALALRTGTASLKSFRGGWTRIYFGRMPAPVIAAYTLDMMNAAIDREIRLYQKTTHYKRKRTHRAKSRATLAFTDGIVARLLQALDQKFGSGADLQKLHQEACAYRDRLHPDASFDSRKMHRAVDRGAASRGYAAGDRVRLSDGVAAEGAAGAIGRGPRLIGRR